MLNVLKTLLLRQTVTVVDNQEIIRTYCTIVSCLHSPEKVVLVK